MDEDAFIASLQQQQQEQQEEEYDPASVNMAADDDDEEEEEYDPASAFAVPDPTTDHLASMPQSPNTPAANGDGALKPQPAPASASATPSAKQPRTVGGFVVDSDESEDEAPSHSTAAAASGPALKTEEGADDAAQQPTSTSTNTLPQPHQHDVQVPSAQDLAGVPAVSHVATTTNDPASFSSSVAPSSAVPLVSTPVHADATKPTDLLNASNLASVRQSTAPVTPQPPVSASPGAAGAALPKARLPQDKVGIMEDRIAEDPRGDLEAWTSLIDDYRRRHKHEHVRAVLERFLKLFPTAGEQWLEYVNFENELDEKAKVEHLFGRSIMSSFWIPLWTAYVNHIRRTHNLTTDQTGEAQKVITQVYEFVLDHVGIDPTSGQLWLDYIEMVKSLPGTAGGPGWQNQQKMDQLRRVYQRAVSVPHNATLEIWRDYDRFEMSVNRLTGRKYLQEKSPAYMTARSAITVLDNITKGVRRTTLPRLPPAPGFDGHEEYTNQVQLWRNWIQWEKNDPLELANDDRATYNKRVLYIYKSALMALRFWPELWYEAADWCFQNNLHDDGAKFLRDGIEANPESCLLAFKQADRVELRTDFEDGDAGLIRKGKEIRAPYDKCLDALFDLIAQTKKREEHSIARAKENSAAQQAAEDAARAKSKSSDDDADDDDAADERRRQEKQAVLDAQVQAISAGYNAQIHTLKKTLTYAWIALMRAMRRVQGKGGPGAPLPGFRGIFGDARKKGKLLSDAYVVSALIEHYCYQDAASIKIFERGFKLFPDDEQFALEYIKHLVKTHDITNARTVFETIVSRLSQKPENIPKTKPLFKYLHEYESQYGDLAQITKLEQRMGTLFPEDPQLLRFAQRFASPSFDPTTVRPVISPRTQMKPVMPANVVPSVEEPPPSAVPPPFAIQENQRAPTPAAAAQSPRLGSLLPVPQSPKRPLDDTESEQPRKFARGESPLKGAAGRRLDAVRRLQGANSATPVAGPPPAASLPHEINFLLSLIPAAHTYKETRFGPDKMVNFIRGLPDDKVPLPQGMSRQQPQTNMMAGLAAAGGRWGGTTSTTAAQIQDIQAKYGGATGGAGAPMGGMGIPAPMSWGGGGA